jgi:oligopeptide/dipeptide ABC transporter ATP-binding protein
MKKEFNLSMLLITHELGVIAEMSDYVGVMYAGKLMEYGDVFTIFKNPRHPYTKGLLSCVPRIDRKAEIEGIPGSPPDPFDLPEGCRFHTRCLHATEICRREEPKPIQISQEHMVACSRVYEI